MSKKEERKAKMAAMAERAPAVETMLRDRGVAKQQDFTEQSKKTDGVSAGYVANEAVSGDTFILKQFFKTEADCVVPGNKKATQQNLINRRDGVQELLASSMYQFLLYDNTSKEGLVTPDASNPNSLYVRSKFYDNASGLSTFSGASGSGGSFKSDNSNLRNLEGFEKIIAACHILGELDYHAGNIMVQNDGKTVAKIDHGRSFIQFHQDFGTILQATANTFHEFGYSKAIEKGNLSFDARKYAGSLRQMTQQLSDDQIDAIVDRRIDELKAAGFDSKGMVVASTFDTHIDTKDIKNFDDLRRVYKQNIKQNLANMKDISKNMDIVAKFEGAPAGFMEGGWVKAMADSHYKDPVSYAIHNNIKIDGMSALKWTEKNGVTVDGVDIAKLVEMNNIVAKFDGASQEFKDGGWIKTIAESGYRDPVSYACHNNIKIDGMSALRWAAKNGAEIYGLDAAEVAKMGAIIAKFDGVTPEFKNDEWLNVLESSTFRDPVTYAIYNNIKIEGMSALRWAEKNGAKVEGIDLEELLKMREIVAKFDGASQEFKDGGWVKAMIDDNCQNPVEYALYNNIKIEGMSALRWAEKNGAKVEGISDLAAAIRVSDIVAKFDNAAPEFKNGGWVNALAKPKKDPITYAYDKKITIEGRNAVEWAVHNNIDMTLPNGKPITALEYAKNWGIKLDGMSAKEWEANSSLIAKFDDKPELQDGKWAAALKDSGYKDIISYAHHNNIKIEGKSALDYAISHKMKIDGMEASEYAKINITPAPTEVEDKKPDSVVIGDRNASTTEIPGADAVNEVTSYAPAYRPKERQKDIPDSKISEAIDECVSQGVNKENLNKLYNNIINELEAVGQLKPQEREKIKVDQLVDQTLQDLKKQSPKLGTRDKIVHSFSNGLENVGLKSAAKWVKDHFTSTKGKEAISEIERNTTKTAVKSFQERLKQERAGEKSQLLR